MKRTSGQKSRKDKGTGTSFKTIERQDGSGSSRSTVQGGSKGGEGGVNKVTCSRPEQVTFTPTTKQQVMFLYFILEASNSTWTYTGSKVHSFLLHCTSWYRLCTRVWRATSSFRQVTDIWSVNPITSLEKNHRPRNQRKVSGTSGTHVFLNFCHFILGEVRSIHPPHRRRSRCSNRPEMCVQSGP